MAENSSVPDFKQVSSENEEVKNWPSDVFSLSGTFSLQELLKQKVPSAQER